ncbi:DUF3995 domain-containing protein [Actinocorallia populi]|uniref:DUF3995 domain-containing protein n=1 Tax=Actinocorallia populi TaxID=2079200 RepID=UPI001300B957|nr:DUF3995 domain-containing protein [Actinocorallia populi]
MSGVSRRLARAAYWTCAWTFGYAVLKAYWAAGGKALRTTLGFPEHVWRSTGFAVVNGATVAVALVGSVVALGFVRPWGRRAPWWALSVPAWAASGVLLLYSVPKLVLNVLGSVGLLSATGGMSAQEVQRVSRWHLVLWTPFFLVWGLLWGATAWFACKERRSAR